MNWPTAKLKYVAQLGYGDSLSSSESASGQFRAFGSNGPYGWSSTANTKPPSIIIGRKGSYGKINWAPEACFASDTTFFIDSTTCNHDLRWLYWLLQTLELDKWTDEAAVPGLNREVVYSKIVAIPPRAWQRAIADYLDRETARLDALVAAKERLLKLLVEKRRAIITRAVTRGLDPRVPVRHSGVPWLGEIPAHWSVKKFTWHVSITEGQVDPEMEPYVYWPLIAPNHIESETGRLLYQETASEQSAISGKYICRSGDVIYSKIRPALRKATLAKENSLCSADMYPLQVKNGLQSEYLLYFLLSDSFTSWTTLESGRVAMPKINREVLSSIRIPIPPRREQREIVDWITTNTLRIDELRTMAERTAKVLEERRAALIAAAVTGKLEVGRAS